MFKSIINIEEFEDLIQQDKLVVVDFWAELSSTSSFMGPIFKSLADQNPEVDFGHVDKHAFHVSTHEKVFPKTIREYLTILISLASRSERRSHYDGYLCIL
jgi:hypothetical protein